MSRIQHLFTVSMSVPVGLQYRCAHLPTPESPQYLEIFQTVYNHAGTFRSNGCVIDLEPAGYVRVPSEPYLVRDADNLCYAPQRWMFTPEWLNNPDRTQVVEECVVPCDDWLSPEDVMKLDWYREHPFVLADEATGGDAGNSANKRMRSITPASANMRSQSVVSLASSAGQRARSVQPSRPAMKRRKADEGSQESQVSAFHTPIDNFDRYDSMADYDNDTGLFLEDESQPVAGPSRNPSNFPPPAQKNQSSNASNHHQYQSNSHSAYPMHPPPPRPQPFRSNQQSYNETRSAPMLNNIQPNLDELTMTDLGATNARMTTAGFESYVGSPSYNT